MKRDPEVTFAVDDEDTLYVQFGGDLECQFVDSETSGFLESLKDGNPEALAKGLMAQAIEMVIGLSHEMAPAVRKGLVAQFDLDVTEEQGQIIDATVQELMPGFIHHMMKMEQEEGEGE